MSKNRAWHTALSGLVITLSDNESEAKSVLALISAHCAITMEKPVGRYLPIAIESTDARQIHQWLEALPGVAYVDVVFCSTESINKHEFESA